MNPISMVDLKNQHAKIKDEITAEINKVIENTSFINGPAVKDFSSHLEKYLSVKHVIPTGNGTDALQVALMALNLQPGDEVITSDFTFIATVEVIALLQLKPILVDVDPQYFTLLPDAVEKAITPRTKAIIPVHLFGQAAPMDALLDIAQKHNLAIIEDTAQALGSDYLFSNGKTQKLGTIGTMGCTSFFPSKNLGGYGDGGAIFTNDDNLATYLRSIVNHGMTVRYYHDTIGVNSRLDSIQAAILNVKLNHLDSYNQARQKAANYYNTKFKDCKYLTTPAQFPQSTHIYHQYTLMVHEGKRDALKDHLLSKDIPCAIYYPVPLHRQKAYQHYSFSDADFPITNQLSETVLSLPMHTELTTEQLDYITDTILNFLKQ